MFLTLKILVDNVSKYKSCLIYKYFFTATAKVSNVRSCTTCRECLRNDKFSEKINVGKRKDVFEFHVESVGMYSPQDIVLESLKILKEKANKWINILQE